MKLKGWKIIKRGEISINHLPGFFRVLIWMLQIKELVYTFSHV
jgi:hypothetical protein